MSTNTIVLHGKTRWSESLSDYSFREGVEMTVTLPGKQPITHRENARCLSRTTFAEPPQPTPFAKTKAEFAKQVKLEAEGKDRTAWFCTRCLIHLDPSKKADAQLEAEKAKAAAVKPANDQWNTGPGAQTPAPKKTASKPVGAKVTRPRRQAASKRSSAKA